MYPIAMSQLIKRLIKNTPCGLVAWHTELQRRTRFARIKGVHANATLIQRLIRNTARMCDMTYTHTNQDAKMNTFWIRYLCLIS